MNNKSLSNPIYKKLFPETYEKNVKLQAALNAFINKTKYSNNVEALDMDSKLNNAG